MAADTAERIMQEMVPELDDLKRKRIFNATEVKQIVKRRRDFEYSMQKRPPKQEDFLNCIRYEVALECLRRKRSRALHWRTKSISDYAGMRRLHFVFRRGLRNFKGDLRFWYQYVDFCLSCGSTGALGKALLRAVKLHPCEGKLWLLAADRELKLGHANGARKLLLRGLRFLKQAPDLWGELLRLEARVACHLHGVRQRAEGAATLGSATTEGSAAAAGEGAPGVGEGATPAADEGAAAADGGGGAAASEVAWKPSQLVLRRALSQLTDRPEECTAFLCTAARCLDEVRQLAWWTEEDGGHRRWETDVHDAIASHRPGVNENAAWQEVPDDVTLRLWRLWRELQRRSSADWCDIVPAALEKAPPPALQDLAEVLVVGYSSTSPDAREALKRFLAADAVAGDPDLAVSVLGILEDATSATFELRTELEPLTHDLLRKAWKAHPAHPALRFVALQRLAEEEADPKGSGAAAAAAAGVPSSLQRLKASEGCLSADDALLELSAALRSAGAGDAAAALEAALRALRRGEEAEALVEHFLADTLARGSPASFQAACQELSGLAGRLMEPGLRRSVLDSVLKAEARINILRLRQ